MYGGNICVQEFCPFLPYVAWTLESSGEILKIYVDTNPYLRIKNSLKKKKN